MTDVLILSNALDTNGQNARYVQAARKHGQDVKIIDALAIGNVDPGGVVARLQEATVKHPEVGLRIRSAHKQNQYFNFPNDLQWGHDAPKGDRQKVRELAAHADVIHLNNSDRGLFELGMAKSKKPVLLHHHGSLFRNNPQRLLGTAQVYRMIQAVSTIDLQRYAPDRLTWLPTAYDVEDLRRFGLINAREPDGRVRIGHFPTNRELKGTDTFLAAIRELQAEGLPIDLVPDGDWDTKQNGHAWLPRWDWTTTMLAKAQCDIVFDQTTLGYGCNAVEAWAMGIPVIAGADAWTIARMRDQWGALPFSMATPKTIKRVIRQMVESPDMRYESAQRGVAHVIKYHDELPALTILAELYADAIRVHTRPRIQGKGVTFTAKKHKVFHVDGIAVDFTKGTATVTDVKVVEGLRTRAKQRPVFGIEEVA